MLYYPVTELQNLKTKIDTSTKCYSRDNGARKLEFTQTDRWKSSQRSNTNNNERVPTIQIKSFDSSFRFFFL